MATTDPDPAMVAAYDRARRAIPSMLDQLDRVGRLFAAPRARRSGTTDSPLSTNDDDHTRSDG